MPSGTIDSGKYIQSTAPPDSGGGTFGRFMRGVKDATNWVWNNKAEILKTGGEAVKDIGATIGNPILMAAGAGAQAAGNGLERIENKAKKSELEQLLEERNSRLFGNKHVTYSDFPRIHYGRKPTALYQKRNMFDDGEEAKIEQLKRKIEYQQRQGSTSSKKKKKSKK